MVKTILTTTLSSFAILAALSLAACQGSSPTSTNPNGTLALAGPYVYNRATGSYSRFSSDPKCNFALGEPAPACSLSDGGDGAAAAAK